MFVTTLDQENLHWDWYCTYNMVISGRIGFWLGQCYAIDVNLPSVIEECAICLYSR